MRWSIVKFLCCLTAGLQLLTAAAVAQGLMLCVPAEGAAHLENAAQQSKCALEAEPQRDGPAAEGPSECGEPGRPCVDVPVGHVAASTQHAAAQFHPAQLLAVLPPFLHIAPRPPAPTMAFHAACLGAVRPDVVLDSLASIVLVI